MVKRSIPLLLFFVPLITIAQKYNRYISHPSYKDSISFFTYTEGYVKTGRDSLLIKEEISTINKKVEIELTEKLVAKTIPIKVELDSIALNKYVSQLNNMMKTFGIIGGHIEDKYYLRLFKFSDSICLSLKKEGVRFFIGTFYKYNYTDTTVRYFQTLDYKIKSKKGEMNSFDFNGSERAIYFFVIDLETNYPVYFQSRFSKYRRSGIPRDVDIQLDFLTTNRFFKKIKKEKSQRISQRLK